jgi:lactoylglutathione lyase
MRPFKILGVQQIAVGGRDKRRLHKLWVEVLGLTQAGSYRSEVDNVDEEILRIGEGVHAVEVDIMQPLDGEKRPRVDQPPLNHIGLWVDDIQRAVQWLTEQGVRFTPGGIRRGGAGHDICFIHPKGNEQYPLCGEGVLIELVQATPEVIAALG